MNVRTKRLERNGLLFSSPSTLGWPSALVPAFQRLWGYREPGGLVKRAEAKTLVSLSSYESTLPRRSGPSQGKAQRVAAANAFHTLLTMHRLSLRQEFEGEKGGGCL